MSDKAKQDMIDEFVGITGADRDRARFYLESAAWILEVAMGSFYEGDPDDDQDLAMPAMTNRVPDMPEPQDTAGKSSQSKPTRTAPTSRFATIGSMRTEEEDSSSEEEGQAFFAGGSERRFATIGSMRTEEEDSSSEEEGQAFFAGGSERSGQQIIGPKKNKNLVEDLFKSAKEHGAEEVQDDSKPAPSRPTFRGSGYRLGDTEGGPTEMVAGAPRMETRRQVDCVLKLWKDGFSVDDGPLRDYKDPTNRAFLSSVQNGEVPQELIREAKGGEVNLNMEDHRHEDYVKPKVALKAFTGEGHTLGSPVPNVVASTSAPAGGSSSPASSSIKVDESKPTTSIQIRLADGSRLVAKFNHTHTVGDIRSHITSSKPQYAGTSFILQTTFPNKELTNDSETIEGSKLLNAVVVQRLK